jgi:hypothetical protein
MESLWVMGMTPGSRPSATARRESISEGIRADAASNESPRSAMLSNPATSPEIMTLPSSRPHAPTSALATTRAVVVMRRVPKD